MKLSPYNEIDSFLLEKARIIRFLQEIHPRLSQVCVQITLDYGLILAVFDANTVEFFKKNLKWLASQIYVILGIEEFSIYFYSNLVLKSNLRTILEKKDPKILEATKMTVAEPPTIEVNGQASATTNPEDLDSMADAAVNSADPMSILNRILNQKLENACEKLYPNNVIVSIMQQRAGGVLSEYFSRKFDELASQVLSQSSGDRGTEGQDLAPIPLPQIEQPNAAGAADTGTQKTKNTPLASITKKLKKYNPGQSPRARYATHLKDALVILSLNKQEEQNSILEEMINKTEFGSQVLDEIVNRFPLEKQGVARAKLAQELENLAKPEAK